MRFGEAIDMYMNISPEKRVIDDKQDYLVLYEPELFRTKSACVVLGEVLQTILVRTLKLSTTIQGHPDSSETAFSVHTKATTADSFKLSEFIVDNYLNDQYNVFTKSDMWTLVWYSDVKTKYELFEVQPLLDVKYGAVYDGCTPLIYDPFTMYYTYDMIMGFKIIFTTKAGSNTDMTIGPRIPVIHKYECIYDEDMYAKTMDHIISIGERAIIVVLDGSNIKGILLYTTMSSLLRLRNDIHADPNIYSNEYPNNNELRFFEISLNYINSRFYSRFILLNNTPNYNMLNIINLKELKRISHHGIKEEE